MTASGGSVGHFASPFAQGSCPQNPATAPGGIWGDTGKSPRPAEQGRPPAIPPPPLPTTNITKPPKSAKGDEASCISLNTGRNLLRGEKTQNKTRLLKKYQKETNEVRHLPLAGAAPEGEGAGLRPARGGAGVQAPLGGRAWSRAPSTRVLVLLGNWLCPRPPALSPTSAEAARRSHPVTRVPTPGRRTGGGTGDPGQQQRCPQGSALSRALPGLQKELNKSAILHEEPAWRSTSLLLRPWGSTRHKSGTKILQTSALSIVGPKLQGAHSWGNHQGCPLQLTACIQKNNSEIKNPKADKAGAVGGPNPTGTG